jgi:hypothetical protein
VSDGAAGRLWNAIKGQFSKDAEHLRLVHIPEKDAAPLVPNDSYLRLTLTEAFPARQRAWATDRRPVAQASARLLFGQSATGAPATQTFTTLVQPPTAPGTGVFEDYVLTDWLPYRGKPVELQAALHVILGENKLVTAVDIVTDFAALLTPPLSAALAIAGQVAAGIEKIIEANKQRPVLVLHTTLPNPVPGWLALVRATEDELPTGSLAINAAGRLCRRDGTRLAGHDFLVLRVEACRERTDWLTPDLDALLGSALYSYNLGHHDEFEHLRNEALARICFSPDFTWTQRKQLTKMVREQFDEMQVGAVADGGMTIAEIVARRGLPSREEVARLTLDDLLSS